MAWQGGVRESPPLPALPGSAEREGLAMQDPALQFQALAVAALGSWELGSPHQENM